MKVSRVAAIAGLGMVIACSDAARGSSAQVETSARAVGAAPEPNARGAATKAFVDRINEYVLFHNNVRKKGPPLQGTLDPVQLAARQASIAKGIIQQRPNAKEGDFFIPQYQPYLRQIVKDDFANRPLADRKALIVELPKGLQLEVNTVYPTALPLATFPGKLLTALPELPAELEYRIVGRSLVLRDVEANVIVDLMRDVFPIPV